MFFPEKILIQNFELKTILFFVIIGLLSFLFIIWFEGRKDGFDQERIFDMGFLSLISGLLLYIGVSSYISYLKIYLPQSLVLRSDQLLTSIFISFTASVASVVLVSKKLKWSVFRILDIYSLGLSGFSFFVLIGAFFIYKSFHGLYLAGILLLLYFLLLRKRGYVLRSGIMFSVFVVVISVFGLIFYTKPGYLFFFTIFITMSLVNIYLRHRQDMQAKNLPKKLLDSLKNALRQKDKQLKSAQDMLIKEDPFKPGHENDNSEAVEEAILEDSKKEVTDLSLDFVKSVRMQIRRALAKMKIGRYGVCEICGKPIDTARLKVFPEATTCLECSAKQI